jgi:hypothetical protein
VLGSDESYREWGYAALSRGSAANHLYVVPDQGDRNEFAPQDRRTRDPLASIQRSLESSRAQQMATDVGTPLTDAERRAGLARDLDEVTRERDAAKAELGRARSPGEAAQSHWWSRGVDRARGAETEALARRLAALRAEERRLRGELRALDRGAPAARERARENADLTRDR